jgi:osmotically-inducible protein OsmY
MRKMIFAGLAALGAGYFFDPQNGARRRNEARDRALAFFRRQGREATRQARYAQGVAHGTAHKVKDAATPHGDRTYDDVTLESKVESEIFRAPDAPKGRVSVDVQNGVVFPRGELDGQDQIDALVAAARDVEGVQDVQSLLHRPGTPAPTT